MYIYRYLIAVVCCGIACSTGYKFIKNRQYISRSATIVLAPPMFLSTFFLTFVAAFFFVFSSFKAAIGRLAAYFCQFSIYTFINIYIQIYICIFVCMYDSIIVCFQLLVAICSVFLLVLFLYRSDNLFSLVFQLFFLTQ